MTHADILAFAESVFVKARTSMRSGHEEYAPDVANPFSNFETIGRVLGLTRTDVLMVYLLKHLSGLVAYASGRVVQRESVEDRAADAINYVLLLACMAQQVATTRSSDGEPIE